MPGGIASITADICRWFVESIHISSLSIAAACPKEAGFWPTTARRTALFARVLVGEGRRFCFRCFRQCNSLVLTVIMRELSPTAKSLHVTAIPCTALFACQSPSPLGRFPAGLLRVGLPLAAMPLVARGCVIMRELSPTAKSQRFPALHVSLRMPVSNSAGSLSSRTSTCFVYFWQQCRLLHVVVAAVYLTESEDRMQESNALQQLRRNRFDGESTLSSLY